MFKLLMLLLPDWGHVCLLDRKAPWWRCLTFDNAKTIQNGDVALVNDNLLVTDPNLGLFQYATENIKTTQDIENENFVPEPSGSIKKITAIPATNKYVLSILTAENKIIHKVKEVSNGKKHK